jgi:hypothetical protein
MNEPAPLRSAREHLAKAEAGYRNEDGLFHLEEGLALLEEVIAGEEPAHATLARNLETTYAKKICGSVRKLVEGDRALPEPELEHFFKVIVAFDQASVELPAETRALKIELARRLVDRYYEGYSAAQKEEALQRLTEIAGGNETTTRRRGR